jgi:DnaJ-domain-containing protein 1
MAMLFSLRWLACWIGPEIGLSWPVSFSQDIMEVPMETKHASFTTIFDDYVQTWSMFARLFLRGPALHGQAGMTIPRHLQAEYRLLLLPAEANLADVRRQYRELAKLYHPDAGGDHTDFLTLQLAYEQVVEYLHTQR